MKKLLLLSMLVASGMIFQSANAQLRVGVQININSQPDWGPAGYNYATYYYLPEADVYYNVVTREYIYLERGRWVNVRVLPPHLRRTNLYTSYKVVINDSNPWLHHKKYHRKYSQYKNRHDQKNLRDFRNNGRGDLGRNDRRPDFHGAPDGDSYGDHRRNGGGRR